MPDGTEFQTAKNNKQW